MFKPDVVRSARVNVPVIAGGSYYHSESYVRVTEPLLVYTSQILLQACIQRELGEISAEQYTQVFRDNSARFIALARGFSATPTASVAAAAFAGDDAGESPAMDDLVGEIEIRTDEIMSSFRGNREQIERSLAEIRRDVARDRAQIQSANSVLSSLLGENDSPSSTTGSTARGERGAAERLRGLVLVFDTGEAVISPVDRERLLDFARSGCCPSRYVAYGFADVRGTSEYNLALSRLRALRVAETLRHELPSSVIVEAAMGESGAFGADLRNNRIVYVVALEPHTYTND